MARVLVVVPPLTGHVNPTVSVAAVLAERGHEVAWCGLAGAVEPLLAADARFFGCGADAAAVLADIDARSQGLRGAAALKFLWTDVLLPLARGMVPGVEAAVDAFTPDVLFVDQQALAGAVVARRRGLPWATSATTSAELIDPLAALPQVDAWVRAELDAFQEEAGLTAEQRRLGDLRFSEHLTIAFTTEALAPQPADPRRRVAYVGPSFVGRPDTTPFDWDWLARDRPHVLVSLGTVTTDAGTRFLTEAVAGLTGLDLQAIVVDATGTVTVPPGAVLDVLVVPRVPQVALLAHLDAVVCHGGHNTVCEALAHGLPLVVAPIRDDQPIIAEQVVAADAGVRVRFGRVRATELRAAVQRALTDPDLRAGAARVQTSFATAGGPAAVADHLEVLACAPVA